MVGILELLCGPSAVGKTSSIDGVVKSYRYTTRYPRENIEESKKSELLGENGNIYDKKEVLKIIKKEGIFKSKNHGIFVSEEKFKENAEKRKLVGIHIYPKTRIGHLYGFPIDDIKKALEEGENVVEQIAAYDPIESVVKAFEGFNVKTKLFLGSYDEIRKRAFHRSKKIQDYQQRLAQTKSDLKKYLFNIDSFDEVRYNFPEIIDNKNSIEIIDKMISKINDKKGFVVEYDIGFNWQYNIKNKFGYYLDNLIFFNMLEDYLKGNKIKEIVEPEFQFNLKYNNEQIQKTKEIIESESFEKNKELYKRKLKEIEGMIPIRDSFIKVLEKLKTTPEIKLRRTYSSSFIKEINPISEIAYSFNIRGVPEMAYLPYISKLYYEIFGGHENFEEQEDYKKDMKLKNHLLSIRNKGKSKEKDYISDIINNNIIKALLDTEKIKNEIISSKKTIKNFPRDIGRSTIDCYNWKKPDEALEYSLSHASLDLKYCLNLLSTYLEHVVGKVGYYKKIDVIPAIFLDKCEKLDIIELQNILIENSGLKVHGNHYSHKVYQTIKEEVDLLSKCMFHMKETKELEKMIIDYEKIKNHLEKGILIPSIERLENSIIEKHEGLKLKQDFFDMLLDKFYLAYYVSSSELDQTMTTILHVYTAFRDNKKIKNLVEYESVNFLEEYFKGILQNDIYEKSMYRHFFRINLDYLSNVKRIMTSDKSKPNSSSNLWSFPLRADPKTFFQEYFITDFPEPEITYRKIKDTIIKIKILRND